MLEKQGAFSFRRRISTARLVVRRVAAYNSSEPTSNRTTALRAPYLWTNVVLCSIPWKKIMLERSKGALIHFDFSTDFGETCVTLHTSLRLAMENLHRMRGLTLWGPIVPLLSDSDTPAPTLRILTLIYHVPVIDGRLPDSFFAHISPGLQELCLNGLGISPHSPLFGNMFTGLTSLTLIPCRVEHGWTLVQLLTVLERTPSLISLTLDEVLSILPDDLSLHSAVALNPVNLPHLQSLRFEHHRLVDCANLMHHLEIPPSTTINLSTIVTSRIALTLPQPVLPRRNLMYNAPGVPLPLHKFQIMHDDYNPAIQTTIYFSCSPTGNQEGMFSLHLEPEGFELSASDVVTVCKDLWLEDVHSLYLSIGRKSFDYATVFALFPAVDKLSVRHSAWHDIVKALASGSADGSDAVQLLCPHLRYLEFYCTKLDWLSRSIDVDENFFEMLATVLEVRRACGMELDRLLIFGEEILCREVADLRMLRKRKILKEYI
ncbi:hypothetical protein HETIRDRAFT_173379 [Heterobasidion irregulare TC 32-1]|uniref:F-box domain-containing protein n=1 Tax=Heterobasidion irregulare (strain TC 32-1) TaxID=747525 RepID=W4K9E3_HETIT|nr:uncharacterized protein HETIRDRAFT_173379 [Heterobasidion irregulare TC 32-1]ETW81701.1 hypothetical protein HETIRDRAFT_173379 [Heterobasidion irregulare TC 32-1]